MSQPQPARRSLRQQLFAGPLSSLTVRGRAVLAAGISAVLCALALGQSDLLRVGVLLVALPVVCAVVLSRRHFRVSCTRTLLPHRIEAGQAARVHLELANVSTTRCSVMLVEERVPFVLGTRPRFVLPGLAPGERRGVAYSVRSEVRGRFTIGPLAVRLSDPFGLVEQARSFTARDQLIVTPPVHVLPGLPWRGDWGGRGDSRPRAVSASGEDDVATREYRHGDDLRRVHWRSTARRGELMVRREEQPWQTRASVLVDRRASGHQGEGLASSLEWAVTATASIAHHLVGLGYMVRLVDGPTGHEWSDPAGAGDGPLLDQLAVLEPGDPSVLAEAIGVARASQRGGLLVAVVGTLNDATAEELARLRRQGTSCVAVVLDTATFRPGFDRSPADPADLVDPVHARACVILRNAGWAVAEARSGESIVQAWEGLRTDDHVLAVVTR
jgi:uncharacterized protein (DUF58 family)